MLEHLTKETFRTKVFDFEKNKEWKFEGTKPCLIDFYADWCGPCKIVAPILEELSQEYKGKVDIFKVNTEEERELSAMFGIQSIPSLLFVPLEGQPQMAMGALPKDTLKRAFKDVFKVENNESVKRE
jgi:thioredoxin 1